MLNQARWTVRWCTPSAMTIGALVSGLSAVRFAAEGNFEMSVKCVQAACVLDGLDGHVARYLGSTTKLGFELDSLCDLANFGVSPALIAYFWARALPVPPNCAQAGVGPWHSTNSLPCLGEGPSRGNLVWAACCVYSACCALRLARFNVAGHAAHMEEQHLQARVPVPAAVRHNVLTRSMYFQGVPAPVGAAYALSPLMLHFRNLPVWIGTWWAGPTGTAIVLSVTGLLMLSPFPTLSSKMLKTNREDSHLRSRHRLSSVAKLFGGILTLTLGFYVPFDLCLVCVLGHLLSLPLGMFLYYFVATDDGTGAEKSN